MPRGRKAGSPKTPKEPVIKPEIIPAGTLEDATYENVKDFQLVGLKTKAKCVRVYDGDTAHLVFPLPPYGVGPLSLVRERCRFLGYNTAEKKSNSTEETIMAAAAKIHLEKAILGKVIDVEFFKFDLYGRPLVQVYLPDETEPGGSTTLDKYMINAGLAVEYHGSGEKKWKK